LIEFYFCCQYNSHDDETLDLMNNALYRFHDSKNGSDFNFPKIHLMQNFQEQIQQYGSLKQWSMEIGE
ncbi:hypothetical protein K440DRAFT_526418, partial [Wilcoxina mikolae CBS 423.85]